MLPDDDLTKLLQTPQFDPHLRYGLSLKEYMLLTIEQIRAIYKNGMAANSM